MEGTPCTHRERMVDLRSGHKPQLRAGGESHRRRLEYIENPVRDCEKNSRHQNPRQREEGEEEIVLPM